MSLPSQFDLSSSYSKGVRFPPVVSSAAVKLAETFEVRDDDVIVSAYVKSGTTWTKQIVSLVCTEGDVSEVSKIPLSQRVSWLETMEHKATGEPIPKVLKDAPSPRLIQTHLPYHMLPHQLKEGKGKLIYCARNPKDVVVSFHHMRQVALRLPCGTWEENFQEFIRPEEAFYGFWWDVIPEYWRHKDDGNMLFIKYEDMKQYLRGHVVKIASFLGKTLSAQRVDEIVGNCTFSAMKENPATNTSRLPVEQSFIKKDEGNEFIRKGEVGDWKNWFSQQQNEALEAIHQEKMAGLDLTFQFE